MTDEQIMRLRELEAKATPGPWESMDGPNVGIIKDATGRAVAMTIWMLRDFPGIAVPDAAFISAARNAFPELLDEVERLEAELERSRDLVTALRCEVEAKQKKSERLESENVALRSRVEKLEEVRKAAQECLLAEAVTGAQETEEEMERLRARVAALEKEPTR